MKLEKTIKEGFSLSFEVFPPKKNSENIESIYQTIDKLVEFKPDFISVTYGSGGNTVKNTAEIASYIENEKKVTALAHLTGGPSTKENIDSVCDELIKNNVFNILALRGDEPKECKIPFGSNFPHATDLMVYLKDKYKDTFSLAGACYPESHMESDTLYSDIANLKKKQDVGASFLISQIFFDNNHFYRLVKSAKESGVTVPIIAGIMPITNGRQIKRMTKMCGCTIPLSLTNMIERFIDSDDVVREIGINYAVHQIIDLLANGCEGIHIYTMNNASIAGSVLSRVDALLKSVRNEK